jgi:hypothetical protein
VNHKQAQQSSTHFMELVGVFGRLLEGFGDEMPGAYFITQNIVITPTCLHKAVDGYVCLSVCLSGVIDDHEQAVR